jgi:hypothetical protein
MIIEDVVEAYNDLCGVDQYVILLKFCNCIIIWFCDEAHFLFL